MDDDEYQRHEYERLFEAILALCLVALVAIGYCIFQC